ncbi:MAG: hypothetical protein OXG39_16410 [Chloroflexi bacterium]|nr:hypothetical protein [Chloroflexota bacterium]
MLSRLVLVIACLLFATLGSVAQVEFEVDTSRNTSQAFRGFTDEEKVVVEYLYLTEKKQHCISRNITLESENQFMKDIDAHISVCVFPDPRNKDIHHLYVGEPKGIFVEYVVSYNGSVIAVINEGRYTKGISNLPDGVYTIQAFGDYGSAFSLAHEVLATISFSIPSEQDRAT